MGIRFRCHHCEHELHVKDFQAGKRGRCPACQGKFRIPLRDAEHSLEPEDSSEAERPRQPAATAPSAQPSPSSSDATASTATKAPSRETSSAKTEAAKGPATSAVDVGGGAERRSPAIPAQESADITTPPPATATALQPRALSDAPQAIWFVRPPSGGQYGPAPGDAMWQWLQENRISRDSLVWCEGWPEWLAASQVFADYFVASQLDVGSDVNTSAASAPTAAAPGDDATAADLSVPQPLSLGDRNRASRKQRRKRNYTVLIAILSVVMIVLLIALVIVLNNQRAAA